MNDMSQASYVVALITVAVLSFGFWLLLILTRPRFKRLRALEKHPLLLSLFMFVSASALVYFIPWLPLAHALQALILPDRR